MISYAWSTGALRGDSGGLMHEEDFEDAASMNAEEEEAGVGLAQ